MPLTWLACAYYLPQYKTVTDVHRSAYSREHPFGHLLQDALVLPIFDGGNVGIRRRQIEAIFGADGYDAWESTYGADIEDETNGVNGG